VKRSPDGRPATDGVKPPRRVAVTRLARVDLELPDGRYLLSYARQAPKPEPNA